MQRRTNRLHDIFQRGHAAAALVSAGQVAATHLDKHVAAFTQPGHVGLRGGVVPHAVVHRRGDNQRFSHGQGGTGQQVVGDAMGQLGQDVGRAGGHHHQVGPVGQGNVFGMPVKVLGKHVDTYLVPGQCLKGQRGDELRASPRHDHAHLAAFLLEQADELGGFEGRDGTGDPEQYTLTHRGYSPFR